VNDADGGGKPQRNGALGYDQSVVRVANSPANHRVDVHMKVGVPGEQFQLLVEHLQALLRYFVRIHVVDADLQMIEPGLVQCRDAVCRQQVPVGDQPGDHSVMADAGDDGIEAGVEQGFPATSRHNGGAETSQQIHPA